MIMKSRDRFKEIIKVFISYGFGYIIDSKINSNKRSPENLRKAFEELGPTFIKIGQILSTSSGILPKEYIDELVKLQDSVKKEEFRNIKEVFEVSVNKTIEECFIYFEEEPSASASVSQVHNAILKDGRGVVVKIQRPDIYEIMKVDMSILKKIFKFTQAKINIAVVDPLDVLQELETTTERELDFIGEGKNILRFKNNNKNVVPIYAPNIVEGLCTSKVITMEYISGFKINDRDMINLKGYSSRDIARKLSISYCKQIFDDGFFHGDPHPGNLLISDGKICFLDFGIVGELDESLKSWLNIAMISVATGDKSKLVDFIMAVGIKNGRVDRGVLYEDIYYLFNTYLTTSLKNIKIEELLVELFNVAKKNNIKFPRELVVLVRSLIILEGVIVEVDPDINIISVITNFVKSKNKTFFLNDIDGDDVLLSAYSFARDSVRIPGKALEALNSIVDGRIKVNFRITELENTISHISNMVNRLVGAVLISSLIIASSLIISNNIGPIYKGISMMGIVGYIISALFAIILLLAVARDEGFKSKRRK